MPNVPESPNFEAIIKLLAITNNEAGFQLQPSGDTRVSDTSVSLLADTGIPQGLIQTSEYGLTQDSGIPQGLIQTSQYGLTLEVTRLNASENLGLIDVVVVNIADQDFDIEIDSGVAPLLFNDLSLPAPVIPIFESDTPAVAVADTDDTPTARQELLLGLTRTCVPFEKYENVNIRAKNRRTT